MECVMRFYVHIHKNAQINLKTMFIVMTMPKNHMQ